MLKFHFSAKSPIYSHVSATLNGLTSIRSYGAQQYVVQDFHRHQVNIMLTNSIVVKSLGI